MEKLNPLSVGEDVAFSSQFEQARSLFGELLYERVLLGSRLQAMVKRVKSVYSALKTRGKQQPRFQEQLRILIEDWRAMELLACAYSLRVFAFRDALKEMEALKGEVSAAVSLGMTPPRLSAEQELLLGMNRSSKEFKKTIMSLAQKAVAEQRLDEYVKELGYVEIPPGMAELIHRSYDEYINIIEILLVKEREEAEKAQQEEAQRASVDLRLKLEQETFNSVESELIEEQKMENQKPKIFLIHGHDELALRNAESLMYRIGCKPVIFSRIPDKATRTNIEILEKHLPACNAVVVLLTPDDEGRKKGTETLEPRARQNVLVEAGFAIISRRTTSLIVALGDVSIPSDFDGINRIQASSWDATTDMSLARELGNMLQLSLDIRHF